VAILHFRCKERRRTLRVTLTVPLTVRGQSDDGEKFSVHAQSQAVNRNGGLLQMDQVVVIGQPLMLVNENSNRFIECRVVAIRHDRDKTYVGVEFVSPDSNFWSMTFPIPGARPLRRPYATKVTA
jgi:hypothetical protein